MAKLAPPKKASKPNAPKKPSTRSKTGNAACSEAASNWQLSLRGKASLDPETYRTLAKCRAMNRTAKMAEAQGRTGKLSAMGEQAVKARLQARFDSGLITQKARTERLDMLLKQRSQRGKAATESKTSFSYGVAKGETIPAVPVEYQAYRSSEYVGMPKQKPKTFTAKPTFDPKAPYDPAKAIEKDKGGQYWALDSSGNRFPTPFKTKQAALERTQSHAALKRDSEPVLVQRATDSGGGEMIPPKPAQPATPKLAPGRGTQSRAIVANALILGRKSVQIKGEYAGYENAGNNAIANLAATPRDRAKQKKMVALLNTYERSYAAQWNSPNPPKRDEHAHGAAMLASGLTGDGLRTARAIAGKYATEKPGIIAVQKPMASAATPSQPARYSLGGKLAPGRGTEERKKASGILRSLRSRNNDGRTIARSIRDNAVHEWGRWGTGKTSVGNDPAFRAKRILNQSEQMRASYESSYADSVIAADKLVTKTGKLSVPGIRGDAKTSFYATMMPAEMAVKKRLESLRASASTALNHVRIMKQAGIPETGYIAKPKPTKDYRKNPLTRLRTAVKLAR